MEWASELVDIMRCVAFFFYCYEDQMCSCTLVKVIVDNAFVVSKNATHIGVVQLHSWYHCKSCEHVLVDT